MSDILPELLKSKIIAIVRGVKPANIVKTARALQEGGIRCLEVTFDQSGERGLEETVQSLKLLRAEFGDSMLIGAGTVLTVKSVDDAAGAGARYIISPNADEAVIRHTKKKGLVSIPGALSPTEIMNARLWGADIVKLFPAGVFGVEYIKAVRAPLSHIPMMAVGGITSDNIRSFLDAGLSGAGVGGKLVDVKAIAAGEFEKLTAAARAYLAALA